MNFVNDISEETLIICSAGSKQRILDIHKLLPIKIMTLNEFLSMYYFSYDEKAIIYLINNYNMNYEVAKNYIDNMYYVNNQEYHNDKLDYLVKLKRELDDNNLFSYHDEFKEYLKRVKIILFDVEVNEFLLRTISEYNYEIKENNYQNYLHNVYEFQTMEDEVYYVAKKIASLIDNGVSIKKIKLANISSDYYNTINRIFTLFNLKVNINYKKAFISIDIVKKFINLYLENDNIDEVLNELDQNDSYYNELINVINKYLRYQNKEFLIYKLEHTYIESCHYTNDIEIIDYLDYISEEDEYIFMLGFNDTLVPNSYQDTNYITDNIVNLVGLNDTKYKNKQLRKRIIDKIRDIKNLTITYKLQDFSKKYYPSTLCSNYEVIKGIIDCEVSYSEIYDKLYLANLYDNYFKYGIKSDELEIYRSNYQIDYNGYSNKFTGIKRVMDKLNLSYSKMQTYNKCAFRYYLGNILKLDIFEENFSTVIGSMVHYVMQKCLENNSNNIEYYVDEFFGDRTFTKKENFFLKKYKEAIHELLQQVLFEREYMLFNKAMYEKKIDIDYGNNVHFVGIIDKVLYYVDDDTTYVALVDYKTGMDDISLKYLEYGLNIQLPIYLYLASKLSFKNIKYTRFYLQKFNLTNKDYRLVGYANSDKNILRINDNNYDNSKIIKGLKTISDGSFTKNSKVLSSDDMNEIINKTQTIIEDVIDKIKNNHFEINPKVADGKEIGCEFCKFRDICFMTKDDEITIYPKEFGGDL